MNSFSRKLLHKYALPLVCLLPEIAAPLQAKEGLPAVHLRLAYPQIKLDRPLWLCEAPDASQRLFVVEQAGRIHILPRDRKARETKVFLDISDRKPFEKNEEGLLGLAFHPEFKSNHKFYIYYTQQNPKRSVISEIEVSPDNPDAADLSTERVVMEIPEPYWNHNGGVLIFGPDGYLYVGLGDGGAANDPHGNGQNLETLLGSILRIDVNSKTGHLAYGIPNDNPFVGKGNGVREEIWAYGIRNAWRMSFDRQTGDLWLGDVGQDQFEEVDLVVKGGNYGWNFREGFHAFQNKTSPPGANFIDPILEYPHLAIYDPSNPHSPGLSITGGYVYRGHKLPNLRGVYVYADFASGTIWGLRYANQKVAASGALVTMPQDLKPPRNISSFGEDENGELYVLAFDGGIYELVEDGPAAR